ncbi:MAG: FAD-dependent oxidoreductase [bacterium]
MKKYDVVIVGGGPAGIITAMTAKTYYPDKSMLIIRKEKNVLVPCGIPYTMSTITLEKNYIPDAGLTGKGIEIEIAEVTKIDSVKKQIETEKGGFEYDKLVLAAGSRPAEPKWLKGRDKKNVFYIEKSEEYLKTLKNSLDKKKRVLIIGGGFIGVEVADELNKEGHKVTLVEKLPHVLSLAIDSDFSCNLDDTLKKRGIELFLGESVEEITGDEFVDGVILENKKKVDADVVIIAIGYSPNSKLAKEAGALVGVKGAIWVDEYMRTNIKDIFAVGDCAERKSFITRKLTNIMLASTATSEARIAGANLYKLQMLRTFTGTIGIFSTRIGECAIGSAGLTETQAVEEGFEVISATFETKDRHPGSLPDASTVRVKLIASKMSGLILGGQIGGGESVGEMINIVGLMIQNKMSVHDLMILQIGTHPLLTAAPTVYPLIKVAELIISKL